MRVHELILLFCRRPGAAIYQPQFTNGKPYKIKSPGNRAGVYRSHGAVNHQNNGTRHPLSILRFAKPSSRDRLHPTEKPVALLSWMVNSWTRPCMPILDPFMGSASTGEAALAAGRPFIGIEKDPEIYRIARRRLWPLMDARSKVGHGDRL